MLGVLKSGGACLPVDPSYPSARITAMLDTSEARVVVTDSARAASSGLADSQTRRVVLLDQEWALVQVCVCVLVFPSIQFGIAL